MVTKFRSVGAFLLLTIFYDQILALMQYNYTVGLKSASKKI